MADPTEVSLVRLRGLFWGLLLVVADVRVEDVDLVPDPLGWLLALVACGAVARRHPGLLVAALGCGAGLLASLPEWVQPAATPWGVVVAVAETTVVFGTCTALMALRPARRGAANAIRWWDLGLTLAASLPWALARAGGAVPVVVAVVLALVALGIFGWFLVLVLRVSAGPENSPEIGPLPA